MLTPLIAWGIGGFETRQLIVFLTPHLPPRQPSSVYNQIRRTHSCLMRIQQHFKSVKEPLVCGLNFRPRSAGASQPELGKVRSDTFPPLTLLRLSCSLSFFCLSPRCQKMLFFLLPVVALLLSTRTTLSANEKWPSAAAQYGKDRSWNRFRDVSCTESPHTPPTVTLTGLIVCVPVCVRGQRVRPR